MSYERFRASITAPALIAIADHWNGIRAGRLMPAWRDIDPAAIKKYLPIVWSWRWEPAQETFIGRLSGEAIIAVLGKRTRGKRMEECFRPDVHEALLARYKRVIGEPALMRSHGKVFVLSGRGGHGERIVLPLAADGRHGDGIFGATEYQLDIEPRIDTFSRDYHGEVIEFFALK